MKLERSIERWAALSPKAVADGSPAQSMFCIADAQKDIARLAEALRPFARIASQTDPMINCNDGLSIEHARDDALACGLNIKVGALRHARDLLAEDTRHAE